MSRMGTFGVRDRADADLVALRDVFRRASLSNDEDRAVLLANADALVWPDTKRPGRRTRVATDADGQIVGFATTTSTRDALELEDLFVDPDCRRRGVAMQLVRDAAVTARTLAHPFIEVTANPHAAAFYAAAGFVEAGAAMTRFGPAARLLLPVADPTNHR